VCVSEHLCQQDPRIISNRGTQDDFAAWSSRARIAKGNENKGTLEDFCSKRLKFSLQMPM